MIHSLFTVDVFQATLHVLHCTRLYRSSVIISCCFWLFVAVTVIVIFLCKMFCVQDGNVGKIQQ